jgi:hypothetical protein
MAYLVDTNVLGRLANRVREVVSSNPADPTVSQT